METTPTVGIVVINEGRVLLVRHKEQAGHLTGTYGLPAGRIEENESPAEAAKRELKEETGGLETDINDLKELPTIYHASIPRKDGTIRNFSFRVYLCKNHKGELEENPEAMPEWIEITQLKNYNLLPNVENAINDALNLLSKT